MKRRSFNSALIAGIGAPALIGLSSAARAQSAGKPTTIRIEIGRAHV